MFRLKLLGLGVSATIAAVALIYPGAALALAPVITSRTGSDGAVHTTWTGKSVFPFQFECGNPSEADVSVTTWSTRYTTHKDKTIAGHDQATGTFNDAGAYRSVASSDGRVRSGLFNDYYTWAGVDPVYGDDGSVVTAASFHTTPSRRLTLFDHGQLFQYSVWGFNSTPYDSATAAPVSDTTQCGPAA